MINIESNISFFTLSLFVAYLAHAEDMKCAIYVCRAPFSLLILDHLKQKKVENLLPLRAVNISTDRVFLKYINGKCIRHAVGINTFGSLDVWRVSWILQMLTNIRITLLDGRLLRSWRIVE